LALLLLNAAADLRGVHSHGTHWGSSQSRVFTVASGAIFQFGCRVTT
jgi:hypothetical protein